MMLPLLIVVSLLSFSSADHAGHCPGKFTSPACQSYANGGRAMKRLHDVCSAVPFASGCSVHRFCHDVDGEVEDACHPVNHLLAVCQEFPDLEECGELGRACGALEELPSCEGIVNLMLPSTHDTFRATRQFCEMMEMEGCEQCRATEADPEMTNDRVSFMNACMDPLGTLSSLCKAMDAVACDGWKEWCAMETTNKIPGVCKEQDGHMHQHHGEEEGMHKKSAASMTLANEACVDDPTAASCAGYVYPLDSIEEDLLNLCVKGGMSMPWMTGCSIRNACKDMNSADGLCAPFTILATICADMPGMPGCNSYNSLCSDGSVVRQCSGNRPIPQVPGTMKTQRDIVSACSSHTMSACFDCRATGASCPKTLETMSALCFTMPSMQFCSDHRHFCSATNGVFGRFCDASSGDFLPPMRMYFHFGQRDIILFKDWIPESTIGYVASFFAVVALGILLQGLKAIRLTMESMWYRKLTSAAANEGDCATCTSTAGPCDPDCERDCADKCGVGSSSQGANNVYRMKRNFCRAILTGLSTCVEFLLMLIAMTFNVGLFIAVVLGVAVGAFFFGHAVERDYVASAGPLSMQTSRRLNLGGNDGCCG